MEYLQIATAATIEEGADAEQMVTSARLLAALFKDGVNPRWRGDGNKFGLVKRASATEVSGRTGDGYVRAADLPSSSAAPNSTTVVRGIIRTATADEAKAGAATGPAVTPQGLQAKLDVFIPPGTSMLFYMAAAPTGWTKSTIINDRLIRVVGGAGAATGGSWQISGITIAGHKLTEDEIPAHSHGAGTLGTGVSGGHTHTILRFSDALSGIAPQDLYIDTARDTTPTNYDLPEGGAHSHGITGSTGNKGGGSEHSHTVTSNSSWRPAHADVIICTRD